MFEQQLGDRSVPALNGYRVGVTPVRIDLSGIRSGRQQRLRHFAVALGNSQVQRSHAVLASDVWVVTTTNMQPHRSEYTGARSHTKEPVVVDHGSNQLNL
jgi:hypothetical protein